MKIYDRITKKIFVCEGTKELIHSRFLRDNKSDYIIPNQDGTINNIDVRIPPEQFLDESSDDILMAINDEIQDAKSDNNFILLKNIAQISPLYRNDNIIELKQKDKEIIKKYRQLERIFEKPEIDITKSEERVHLSKVKRINYKTISFLATHSEDWEYRKYDKIIPKKLFAENQVIDYEIYENIVAKTLIIKLKKYWNSLKKAKDIIIENNISLAKLEDMYTKDNHGKNYRMYMLSSAEFYKSLLEKSKILKNTIQDIRDIQKRTISLNGSVLDRNVKKIISEYSVVKMTNKFRHHQDYKIIPQIWAVISRSDLSIDELYTQLNKTIINFIHYQLLIIIRVLLDLGWKNEDIFYYRTLFLDKPKYLFQKDEMRLILNISGDYCITLTLLNHSLSFIPIAANINNITEPTISELIADVKNDKKDNEIKVIVFYNNKNKDEVPLSDCIIKDYDSLYKKDAMGNKLVITSISPLDIYSTERIRRLFLQWFYDRLLEKYPYSIDCPTVVSKYIELNKYGFQYSKKNKLMLSHSYIQDYKKIKEEIERKSESIPKQDKDDFTLKSGLFIEMLENKEISSIYKILTMCPVCDLENTRNIDLRDNNEIEIKCASCKTIWGIKYCYDCNKSTFYLKIPKFETIIAEIIKKKEEHEELSSDIVAEKINSNYLDKIKEEKLASDLIADFEIVDSETKEVKWKCSHCLQTIK